MKRIIACIDASPCVHATADAAAWIAQKTGRQLILLQVLDYRFASEHLSAFGGIVGFESNAMLLQELEELDKKQRQLAQQYSYDLLQHISEYIAEKFGIQVVTIQHQGEFLEQTLKDLQADDIAVIGKVGEHAAESHKPCGSNVERLIWAAKTTVLVVGESFSPAKHFLFAYEHSEICQAILKRVGQSDLLKYLTCHLVYVGTQNGILDKPMDYLKFVGLEARAEYLYGDVAESLIAYQKQHDIGLIVMGAFGRNKLYQFFLGSTTLKILKASDVPLLVVR